MSLPRRGLQGGKIVGIKFHFRKLTSDSPAIGRLICLAERDNVYHVESQLAAGFFSADPDNGVRFLASIEHQGDPDYWDIVEVPETSNLQIELWADSMAGHKPPFAYDFVGAFNSAMGIHERDPYKWFCSLVAVEVASRAGIVGLDPMPDPALLRSQLKQHAGLLGAGERVYYPVAGLALGDADVAYVSQLVDDRLIDSALAQKLIQRMAA
jgi:hypothetical protein